MVRDGADGRPASGTVGEQPTGIDPAVDPATDRRADYDYGGGDVARPGMAADLVRLVDGEVRFDDYTRAMYATDASIYEVTPIGVVYPTSTADVAAVLEYCSERLVAVLPRGGGTSLGGQAVNEAVVLDFTRHMDRVLATDPAAATATAQPGIRLGDLNAALAPHGLKFAPDPAWGDKSVLGGAVGNNSTGAHSLVYGATDAYIEELEVVLANGTVHRFGEVTIAELREGAAADGYLGRIHATLLEFIVSEADAIRAAYPALDRNVSGYNLDRLVAEGTTALEDETATVNLARVFAGSEGTLGVVTEITVALEPVPATKAMALLAYDDLLAALADVEPTLAFDPAAVEVLDDVLLDLARDTSEFGPLVRETVPAEAGAVLLVEFYVDSRTDGERQVATLLADRAPETTTVGTATDGPTTDAPVRATYAAEAHDEADRDRFWRLRKSGLPILLGRTTDAKHISFIEDTAVPPDALPAYVADVQAVLDDHDTFASFYAHAGPGCLHIRPLVNTKTVDGIEAMRSIADATTDLVLEYDGAVSGEHGDGRARSQWNRKLYGDHVFELFVDLKSAFDPYWLLNPGQVCGDVDLAEDLRYDPDYGFDPGFEPALAWETANGLQGMVELCHGCGGCRGPQATTGGVMCPTYRAAGTDEEILSTRGRANMLRAAMSGRLDVAATDDEFVREVLDLCIGCKGCRNDCPSEVDMAKLKAEVTHAHHQATGASLRDRLFANLPTVARLASAVAPATNRLAALPGAGRLAERTLGIARERELPTFAAASFEAWFEDREPRIGPGDADRRVLLVPDPVTNYIEPAVGRAAVRVLEAADVHVALADVSATGRAAYSKGFLETARKRARSAVATLAPSVEAGWDVVLVEPSEAVMLQTDARDLLEGAAVDLVADYTYGVCEYLDVHGLDAALPVDGDGESLLYHGHCHQQATKRDHHAVAVLRRAGFEVEPLDSTCCGMAGAFGYEAEHYSMSQAIGRQLFEQVDAAPGTPVAPGTSCRTQLSDRPGGDRPAHPIETLAAGLEPDVEPRPDP